MNNRRRDDDILFTKTAMTCVMVGQRKILQTKDHLPTRHGEEGAKNRAILAQPKTFGKSNFWVRGSRVVR